MALIYLYEVFLDERGLNGWNEAFKLDNGKGKNSILILYSQVFHLSSYNSEDRSFVTADVSALRFVAVYLEGSFT